MNDIIVFSNGHQEHILNLKMLFDKLKINLISAIQKLASVTSKNLFRKICLIVVDLSHPPGPTIMDPQSKNDPELIFLNSQYPCQSGTVVFNLNSLLFGTKLLLTPLMLNCIPISF